MLKGQIRDMVNEVDESRAYFEEELFSRLKSTALLIK